ncbi:hypothetical protein BFF78_09280 [Streptomyces fodineus]|uniref:Uncharacterized protein n=1 Tax=Streptomyces fodineus TaxID=1904616 RepID=A0A1D7Y6J6_9ACTN|nr:hypothetical protein BFF78_09280 [Streptomyces fodineus]
MATVEPTDHASLLALRSEPPRHPRPVPWSPYLLFGTGQFKTRGKLDYDLPFIPVVMVISPIRTGMCRRTEAVTVATAGPGALLPGGEPPMAPKP